tara:strand:- start:259 stop:1275 length:1017 start_codon:yes stop_codon:yes gene_type:complete
MTLSEHESVNEIEIDMNNGDTSLANDIEENNNSNKDDKAMSDIKNRRGDRQILVTDSVMHSIPLDEIRSGGPPKDGIPSIDNPKFIPAADADFIEDDAIGLGLSYKEDVRFYPFSILVWHEIVNDEVSGDPVLVTYCPLCATAVVFDSRIDGETAKFGVSGRLWQSNLLMYNRTKNSSDESLWSQVLGEAVLGVHTGIRLDIIPADTVRFGDWKRAHPDTLVLSQDTGALRSYGSDPYGDYYTSNNTIFPTNFNDNRLHPKALVIGIELNGKTKAYLNESLSVGTTKDTFSGETITIEKSDAGEVRFFAGDARVSVSGLWGFWFSWQAVHPDTELYDK